MTRPALIVGTLLLLTAIPAGAQDASEFRGTGREISVIPKKSNAFSGSLGIGRSQSAGLGGTLYSGTLGGTLVQDKLWLFAAAEQQTSRLGVAGVESSSGFDTNAVDAKVLANLGDRQNLAALFTQSRQPASPALFGGTTLPASFLSMRYTGIVTESMFFTASVSRSTGTQRDDGPAYAGQ